MGKWQGEVFLTTEAGGVRGRWGGGVVHLLLGRTIKVTPAGEEKQDAVVIDAEIVDDGYRLKLTVEGDTPQVTPNLTGMSVDV